MNKTLGVVLVILGCLGLPKIVFAQADAVDPNGIGPQVGETMPDFMLQNHRGETRTLASLYGPRGLMLVFSRSADW